MRINGRIMTKYYLCRPEDELYSSLIPDAIKSPVR